MINSIVTFPIWKNDGKSVESLNKVQTKSIEEFINEIKNNKIKFVHNYCLCGNTDPKLDLVVSEKDRYGIPCTIVLCKKCGLIRLKEMLDEDSTSRFYKDFYRNIYSGKGILSDEFFKEQIARGEEFFKLFNNFIDMDEINNVFEVGCGAGGILYPFFKAGKSVAGCDFGEKYLLYGQSKGLNLYLGKITETNIKKESQDLIILSHVMEHFNNPIESINDLLEYITPEKYLLVEVPGFFWIPKIYFNPILYFQNAHVYNYYYYYLKVFFERLGLKVIYGNERCTFLLKKPSNWIKRENVVIYDKNMELWALKVEEELKKYYIIHLLKLNPYYLKACLVNILDILGIKQIIKKVWYKVNR